MGLATTLQTVSDHKKVMVDDTHYSLVSRWLSIYQSSPDWQQIHRKLSDDTMLNRQMMSLNMGEVSAKKMAGLVFNQKANISVSPHSDDDGSKPSSPDDYKAAENEFVQQVLNDNHFFNNFERYLEYMFGTGGIVIRLYTDRGKVKIRFATADAFYPISADANGVSECVIASTFISNNKHYTLLEWHEEDDTAYIVTNEIYQSIDDKGDDLGMKITDWSTLPDAFKNMSPTPTRYSKAVYSQPTFIYLKPNLANNLEINSPLGLPIYANAIDTLKQLDQAYDLLWQEFYMGRRRIIAPDNQLMRTVDPQTGKAKTYVDFQEGVYETYDTTMSGGDGESVKPTDITLPLRNESIVSGINDLLHFYSSQVGFSSDAFTFDSKTGMVTATAVVSENSDTYQTKNSHETLIEDAIKHMCQSIVELAKNDPAVKYSGQTDIDVSVNFDDSIAKDRDENLKFFMTANGNRPVMTQLEAIKRANNLTDVEAQQWLADIQAEQANAEGDIDDVVGNGNKDGEDNA
ncbi:phage portal protein [Furfurilactobacillus milii]|uniref:Phage portal protein n=1 Tax=Furfurilactobacillus milii TaxID=2888272 RepID=A0ABT6DCN4_9LACO|nr:phage portal protein [Furfurilactobacillus milii]QLE67425.1 phage protein [Furfurilactobacillus rossiae]MCF6161897.1 phage portal protein [Furfurilactobacillus milii]MCF6164277.1 phage portal protein [Furfurilactobacillus milii]MDF9914902.1 phage portal protein [Furfurilactobacillus milii]QLE69854.1 phage protein [Furfurilactobacillus rossiae]